MSKRREVIFRNKQYQSIILHDWYQERYQNYFTRKEKPPLSLDFTGAVERSRTSDLLITNYKNAVFNGFDTFLISFKSLLFKGVSPYNLSQCPRMVFNPSFDTRSTRK